MASTVSKGNYYKRKTKEYFEKLGYYTEITEFMCGRQIAPNKIIYVKKDVFQSDGISTNGKDIIFWNSKHFTNDRSKIEQIRQGIKTYKKIPFPLSVKRQLVIWKPRSKIPQIIDC